MVCKQVLPLIHNHFDGDITAEEAMELKHHLHSCQDCRRYFRMTEKTEAIVRSLPPAASSPELTQRIMDALPVERKRNVWFRWVKRHPAASVAALFGAIMLWSFLTLWNEDQQLLVKGADLDQVIIQGDTVIIPEGRTIHGDLMVRSGKIQVEGDIKGNLVVVDGTVNLASTAHISGQITRINQAFGWLWFKMNEWLGFFSK